MQKQQYKHSEEDVHNINMESTTHNNFVNMRKNLKQHIINMKKHNITT